MILLASVLVALGVTLFLVSYIAKMLNAKRHGPGWIFVSWITGGIAAAGVMLIFGLFLQGFDPALVMILSFIISLLAASAAYKYINQMGWGGAITTHISSSIISLIAILTAVILNGHSLKNSIDSLDIAKHQGAILNGFQPGVNPADRASADADLQSGLYTDDPAIHDTEDSEADRLSRQNPDSPADAELNAQKTAQNDVEIMEAEPKEEDLLPIGAKKEIKQAQRPYVSPKYHVVTIGKIRSYVGRQIRIHKDNGKVVAGALETIRGGDAVVKQRIHGGEAVTPVTISRIRKLEVYR